MHLADGIRLNKVPREARRSMPKPPIGPKHTRLPSGLYNQMIAPLHRYPIKGVIWYQGEANANNFKRVNEYKYFLPDMIKSWRKAWGIGDFPFYWVQLAPYKKVSSRPQDDSWPWMRYIMDKVQDEVENGAMACILDGGMQKDIHPPYKKYVGDRLALLARKLTYGEDIVHKGPTFKSLEVEKNKIIITFDNIGSGLMVKRLSLDNGNILVENNKLLGFTICGDNGQFAIAEAKIIKGGKVEVSSKKNK